MSSQLATHDLIECSCRQAIDQHVCQYRPPSVDDNAEAWAEIFRQSIAGMGSTVMVLAPWDHPVVLTRCDPRSLFRDPRAGSS